MGCCDWTLLNHIEERDPRLVSLAASVMPFASNLLKDCWVEKDDDGQWVFAFRFELPDGCMTVTRSNMKGEYFLFFVQPEQTVRVEHWRSAANGEPETLLREGAIPLASLWAFLRQFPSRQVDGFALGLLMTKAGGE